MRGSIQKRGKGSWRLVFDLERDHTGKRRQKVVSFKGNRKSAEAELRRLLSTHENGGFVEPGKLLVKEFLEQWLADHGTLKVSAKTAERYAEICRQHLIPALGHHKLSKLHALHIQASYTEAINSGRRDGKGGLSPRTVLQHHRVLRMALQRAVKFELIARNPADAVDAPRFEKKKMVVLDEAQVATLLNGAQGTSLYVPTLLAATTGMRRGEILALRWSALDLERGTVAVVQSLEQRIGGLHFKEPKTERGKRSITLPSVTIEALRQHKARQARQRLQLGLGRDDNGLVCARYDGEPRSPQSLTREFKGLVAKLDIPRITFHGLRHSHATQLLRAGIHPKVAQERLGHSTIATTMDLYSHVTESMQEDAAARVDAALRAAIGKQKSNKN